jgi:hypothetical protein
MHTSTLTADPTKSNAQSPTVQPSHLTHPESHMSTLVGSPAVPQSKYRILPAADPTRALEMQTGGDFRVHIAELNESNETQIVSLIIIFTMKAGSERCSHFTPQWKIVPHADTKDDTKYQIKNSMNRGILGITKSRDNPDDGFVACGLHDYFWTIEPRGRSFMCAFL